MGTLQGTGPFTVFAPTNAAFDALPAGTLASLLEPANKQQLADILTYHVLAAKVLSSQLTNGQTAATVQGQDITVQINGATVTINSVATVTQPDVIACNGVVHVIDAVLLPPTSNTTAAPTPPGSINGAGKDDKGDKSDDDSDSSLYWLLLLIIPV